jgi:hypothetical protein
VVSPNAVTTHLFKVAAVDKRTVHKNKDSDPELIFSVESCGYSDYDSTEYFALCVWWSVILYDMCQEISVHFVRFWFWLPQKNVHRQFLLKT